MSTLATCTIGLSVQVLASGIVPCGVNGELGVGDCYYLAMSIRFFGLLHY